MVFRSVVFVSHIGWHVPPGSLVIRRHLLVAVSFSQHHIEVLAKYLLMILPTLVEFLRFLVVSGLHSLIPPQSRLRLVSVEVVVSRLYRQTVGVIVLRKLGLCLSLEGLPVLVTLRELTTQLLKVKIVLESILVTSVAVVGLMVHVLDFLTVGMGEAL